MAITRFNPDQINSKSIDGSKLTDNITLGGGLKLTTSLTNLDTTYTSSINLNSGVAITSDGPSYINGNKVGIRTSSPDSNYDITMVGNTYINGNLNVSGAVNYTSSETIQLTDNVLLLNSNFTGAASENAGLEVERGDYTNAKLTWDETNNYWTISNPVDNANAVSSYRIIDQNYGDGRYMAIGNTSFAAVISITTSTDQILELKQTGGGQNYMAFLSDKAQSGTYARKAYFGIASDDIGLMMKAEDAAGYIKLDNNVTITGNISMGANSTVDGIDISVHAASATAHHDNSNDPTAGQKAALAGTNGSPADTNRYVTNSDSRMTDTRTPKAHALIDTVNHTVSGLTAGQVIRASGATTYAFAQLDHTDLKGVSADQHHAQAHDINGNDHTNGPLKVGKGGTGITAVTAGYIPYGSTTDALSTSSNLFWDSTNSRLGLGTTTPNGRLDVRGSGTGLVKLVDTTAVAIDVGATLDFGGYYNATAFSTYGRIKAGKSSSTSGEAAGYLSFYSSSVSGGSLNEWMRIDTAGNVGIGTTGPSYKLDVAGTINTSGNITLSTANATVDGRDVSADGAKLDTLETIRSKRGRAAVITSAAITQDTATKLSTLGISSLSWDASKSIVLVNVEGSLQVQDVDINNQFDYSISSTDTITFHYDIPASSVIEIIVL